MSQDIKLKSPAIIFYNEIKRDTRTNEYKNGCWQMSVDVRCFKCNHLQPYVAYKNCQRCCEPSDFGIVKVTDYPIIIANKELAKQVQDEIDSVLVAAAFAEYSEAFCLLRTYGDNPYLEVHFKKGIKVVKLFFFIERQDNMFGCVVRYGCNVTDTFGKLDNGYFETENFSSVFERARREM